MCIAQILKMFNFIPNEMFLRGFLLHYFQMKKNVSESNCILVEVYGDHAPIEQKCQKWFTRFESGNFNLDDEEQTRTSKKLEEEEEVPLKVTRHTISRRLREAFLVKWQDIKREYLYHHQKKCFCYEFYFITLT